ncbi:hypothetical protein D1164_22275 [Mariniphaga sediminis]|uniref:Uncharacterized protein n=1 Tax=Mariniphaga sediminis TaxID=1628158 RepID=A0A399CS82_9BACT|nr:hypothetical protein [Mariniphaga sediminis]RIH62944.1 hypothetical protein D1164_22275 [Mariniphaga sediminis]
MNRELRQFITRIFIASIVLAAAGAGIFAFVVPQHYLPVLPWMLGFFALITILLHGYQLRLAKKDVARFTRSSMLVSLFRLMLYSIFAIVYMVVDSTEVAAFVVSLVVIYIVFTFIEVADLSRISRSNQK